MRFAVAARATPAQAASPDQGLDRANLGTTCAADPHAPSHWRVHGPIANMPEFATAFGCKAGDIMVRADSLRPQIR